MAAYHIKQHFSGLRVQTARRGRDPFATGFEDDSEEDTRKSRTRTKAPVSNKPARNALNSSASPFANIDALKHESDDDDFLNFQPTKRTDRRPSPSPAYLAAQRVIDGQGRRGSLPGALPTTDPKKAVVLAAGPLAYLDDSSEDEAPPTRRNRRPSPAPRHPSDPDSRRNRSQTPAGQGGLGNRDKATGVKPNTIVPKHTIASPFAGTKYLQDSDSDSDEEAVSSRKGSADSTENNNEPQPQPQPQKKSTHLEVKRVDKPKQNGSGVSWRAFSASRAEQRYAEVEALQTSLRQRGRAISFSPHVTTDDGQRIPLSPTCERPTNPNGRGKRLGRSKSPPRRVEDTKPTEDEMVDRESVGGPVGVYDPAQYKTNPFSGEPVRRSRTNSEGDKAQRPGAVSTSSLPDIRIDDIAQQ